MRTQRNGGVGKLVLESLYYELHLRDEMLQHLPNIDMKDDAQRLIRSGRQLSQRDRRDQASDEEDHYRREEPLAPERQPGQEGMRLHIVNEGATLHDERAYRRLRRRSRCARTRLLPRGGNRSAVTLLSLGSLILPRLWLSQRGIRYLFTAPARLTRRAGYGGRIRLRRAGRGMKWLATILALCRMTRIQLLATWAILDEEVLALRAA